MYYAPQQGAFTCRCRLVCGFGRLWVSTSSCRRIVYVYAPEEGFPGVVLEMMPLGGCVFDLLNHPLPSLPLPSPPLLLPLPPTRCHFGSRYSKAPAALIGPEVEPGKEFPSFNQRSSLSFSLFLPLRSSLSPFIPHNFLSCLFESLPDGPRRAQHLKTTVAFKSGGSLDGSRRAQNLKTTVVFKSGWSFMPPQRVPGLLSGTDTIRYYA